MANGKLQGAVYLLKVLSKSSEEMCVSGLDGSLCEVQTAFCERNLELLKSYRIPAEETDIETTQCSPLPHSKSTLEGTTKSIQLTYRKHPKLFLAISERNVYKMR